DVTRVNTCPLPVCARPVRAGGYRRRICAIADKEAGTLHVPLSSVSPGHKYVAELYADGPGANWLTNPLPVAISQRPVDATSRLHLALAPGGGQAIRIRPAR